MKIPNSNNLTLENIKAHLDQNNIENKLRSSIFGSMITFKNEGISYRVQIKNNDIILQGMAPTAFRLIPIVIAFILAIILFRGRPFGILGGAIIGALVGVSAVVADFLFLRNKKDQVQKTKEIIEGIDTMEVLKEDI